MLLGRQTDKIKRYDNNKGSSMGFKKFSITPNEQSFESKVGSLVNIGNSLNALAVKGALIGALLTGSSVFAQESSGMSGLVDGIKGATSKVVNVACENKNVTGKVLGFLTGTFQVAEAGVNAGCEANKPGVSAEQALKNASKQVQPSQMASMPSLQGAGATVPVQQVQESSVANTASVVGNPFKAIAQKFGSSESRSRNINTVSPTESIPTNETQSVTAEQNAGGPNILSGLSGLGDKLKKMHQDNARRYAEEQQAPSNNHSMSPN